MNATTAASAGPETEAEVPTGASPQLDAEQILTTLGTPAGRADPYPLYADLQKLGDVVELGPQGALVAGYDNINAVLRDPNFVVSDEAAFDQGFPPGGITPSSFRAWTGS